ncbi:MAG: circadian clock protein KaiB [Brasilonema octagenarum HA4186-MV1]|jgi:circadian clock protein KaiB|uniref:Circadian clock protein KaiB n=2 Tax=Brasilonema TaxID=383614 RepID=A0A856MFN3_9CYAN|nr:MULTISPECIES: circadian clock KaiB family protein [Brasilonema]MBW4629840.1 circadian clock protein KaiB [Brasilonema octagenarum HA4186-MV1]NMF61528.1 circadian clock protein KaiB [Brasilonema octagenarum UFV-OR1]QDL10013.1 circadian clock protein KaiB [Brasilonema sennae CENA114]QDL16366.1 circadian clock protein KaiB [Brasilonema octagenarum UFV-E1]
MSDKYLLKLYITGYTPRSQRAISNLIQLCESHLRNRHEIVIIDVLEQPQVAEAEKILVTPTLIKEFPLPKIRIIGDLSNTHTVLLGLNIPYKQ